MNDKKTLYKQIQTYSFVLYETVLYLDGHPNCRKALAYHAKVKAKLAEATARYEEMFGPLTILGQGCGDSWKWVETPWPWETEDDMMPRRNCGCRQ